MPYKTTLSNLYTVSDNDTDVGLLSVALDTVYCVGIGTNTCCEVMNNTTVSWILLILPMSEVWELHASASFPGYDNGQPKQEL
jgi:hypothetical protein